MTKPQAIESVSNRTGIREKWQLASPLDVTTEGIACWFTEMIILLSEKKISALQDILPSLEIAAASRRPLLIVAEDFDGEAIAVVSSICLHVRYSCAVYDAVVSSVRGSRAVPEEKYCQFSCRSRRLHLDQLEHQGGRERGRA